nr:heterogeneous nuclear ribonucleoprotein k [Hymenolepis microstoma]
MMKREGKDLDGDQPPKKMQKVENGGPIVRFLIPARAAGLIIGRGGENIKRIRNQFSVQLHIPDSRSTERVFTIEGDLDKICDVWRDILPKVKDIISAKLSDPKVIMGQQRIHRRKWNQGDGDQQDADNKDDTDDKMIDIRVLIHQSIAGFIIGKGGEKIRDMKQKHQMRVIKVYQMLAPGSTDRVVQLIAESENAIQCLYEIISVAEKMQVRGPVENYDPANFSEPDALTYGGWLSPEGLKALSQGMLIGSGGGMNNGNPPNQYMGPSGPQHYIRPPPPGVYMPGPPQFQPQSPQRGMPQQMYQQPPQQFAPRGGMPQSSLRPQQPWSSYPDGGGNGYGNANGGFQQQPQPPMPVAPSQTPIGVNQQQQMTGPIIGYGNTSTAGNLYGGMGQMNSPPRGGYNMPPQQQGAPQPNANPQMYRMNAPPPAGQIMNNNSNMGATQPMPPHQFYGAPPPSGNCAPMMPPPYGYSMGAPGPVPAPTIPTVSVMGAGGVPTPGVYPPGGPW